ncbi:hypothetical protein B2J88_49495, partial [Rhodococcus sp. SRB_17]|nr:hypothetical protein [Rhodococcus sp. SRB_17]
MFRPDKLSECSARRCRDDDTGRCDEEEGRALRGSCGGHGTGATRQGTGPVADRAGRPAQTVNRWCAAGIFVRSGVGRQSSSAPGLRFRGGTRLARS